MAPPTSAAGYRDDPAAPPRSAAPHQNMNTRSLDPHQLHRQFAWITVLQRLRGTERAIGSDRQLHTRIVGQRNRGGALAFLDDLHRCDLASVHVDVDDIV